MLKIIKISDEYAISADRQYLAKLRDLPDRRFDATTGLWRAAFVVENYEYMRGLRWPVEACGVPTRSMVEIDGIVHGSSHMLCVKGPNNHAFNAKFKQCPSHYMYSVRHKGWVVMPTQASVDFLKKEFIAAAWKAAASDIVEKIKTLAEKTQQLKETKSQLMQATDIDVSDFKFKTTPYLHQTKGFAMARDQDAFAFLMEQGTGKTKVTIDETAYQRAKGKIDAMLIVCPNDVKDVWVEELQTHMPEWCEYDVVVDGQVKQTELIDFALSKPGPRLKVMITNVEAFASQNRVDIFAKFVGKHRTKMVLDEATRFKNPTAKRTKAMLKLGKNAVIRRILTGTPVTQNPLDVYAPFRFLDPYILGFSSYAVMRLHHAVLGGWQNKQVVGFANVDEIKEKIAPHSYRVLRADCIDLPDKIYQKHSIDLNPEQRRLYDELRDQLVAELANDERVTASHALVKMLRLSQITGGFIKTDVVIPPHIEPDSTEWNEIVAQQEGREPIAIPGTNPKLSTTLDIIEDLSDNDKVVIWARFRAEIENISRVLAEKYGEDSVVMFYGGVDRMQRTVNRHRFQGTKTSQDDPKCRFFVAQVDTGSVGLTLTRANTVIYYSNSYSLETRLQSEDRNHRIGQKQAVTYHDIIAKDTIDVTLVQALRRKKKFADLITGDAWKTWL